MFGDQHQIATTSKAHRSMAKYNHNTQTHSTLDHHRTMGTTHGKSAQITTTAQWAQHMDLRNDNDNTLHLGNGVNGATASNEGANNRHVTPYAKPI